MHEKYFTHLLEKAQNSSELEVPIHALLVQNNEVIAESGNHRQRTNNPMSHAEIEVIEEASQRLGSWRLCDTTLYVLVEPCLMCTGVIYAARVPKVVFGVKNEKGGALLHAQANRKDLGLNHSVEIEYGYYQEEIREILSNFFAAKRG